MDIPKVHHHHSTQGQPNRIPAHEPLACPTHPAAQLRGLREQAGRECRELGNLPCAKQAHAQEAGRQQVEEAGEDRNTYVGAVRVKQLEPCCPARQSPAIGSYLVEIK